MDLTTDIKEYIDSSVLCWLATVSDDNIPNVSPKEIFTYFSDDKVIVANIASPQSVKNIIYNKNVCISFIDILVQKGYQLKGEARVVDIKEDNYAAMEEKLLDITGGNFPFKQIIEISIHQSKKIIAPKYLLYPETTENEQVESAKKAYGF